MQKDSRTPTLLQLIVHSIMGATLGSLLALALIVTNQNIFHFIATSQSPCGEMAVFVGFFSFVVGMGATISGFIFSVMENEEKLQTQRVIQRRPPDNRK